MGAQDLREPLERLGMCGLERMLEALDHLPLEVDANPDEMIGRDLDAQGMGRAADEPEQDRRTATARWRLVDDLDETGRDQPARHGGHGCGAEGEAPRDVRPGNRSLAPDQPQNGRAVEIADKVRGSPLH